MAPTDVSQKPDSPQKPDLPQKTNFFEAFASKMTQATGSTTIFMIALFAVLAWGATGPIFHYSDDWQLVINTTTSVITFLMVFIIQKAQNKDSMAIQLKLNELIAAHEFASNRLVNVENMSEEELKVIQKYYAQLRLLTKEEESYQQSHSIDEKNEKTDNHQNQ